MDAFAGFAGQPPPWPDESRGPALLRTTWALMGTSCLVLVARIWTKLAKVRRLYKDDVCMIFALLFGLVHSALLTKGIENGLGRHMLYLTPRQRQETLRYGVYCLGWGFLSPMAGRIAFCLTMLYIAGTDSKVHRWAKFVTAVFIVLQLVINLIAFVIFYAQCGTHLDALWIPEKMLLISEYCMDVKIQVDLGYFQGAFNCLTDAYLTFLPAILIEHARLSIKKKFGLVCLLCLSVVALAAAIGKTVEAKNLGKQTDYTYDLCLYTIWIEIELNVVIVVSSIPLLRPLLTLFSASRRQQRLPDEQSPGWDTRTFSSVYSKTHKSRTRTTTAHSTSSEENIVPHSSEIFAMETPGSGIQVTKEVEITYQPSDVQFVHAALVGLVQGELTHRPAPSVRSVHR